VTENVTIYIDWVQKFNFSVANGSISFISPESAANNTYAQILVSDAMGVESVTPDRLYYSDKVRASKARVCRCADHERCHDLAVMRFASDSCCRFAVRRRRGLWGRPGLRAVPRGLRPSRRRLLYRSPVFSMASPSAGCYLSWRLPLLAQARVLEQRRCTHSQSRRARWRFVWSSLCLQDDTLVVPCDPPAEERCRGVNNTDAAPRIIDSCPDPQDRARCYAAFRENGCGEVYYAGLPPIVAQILCSMCTVLNSIVAFQVSRVVRAPTGTSRWGRVVPRATQRCSAPCKPRRGDLAWRCTTDDFVSSGPSA